MDGIKSLPSFTDIGMLASPSKFHIRIIPPDDEYAQNPVLNKNSVFASEIYHVQVLG